MNRKSIIAIASCLSVCAVVGVGFSSWLIVNNTANASAEGSITVDTVTDKRVTMTAKWVTSLTDTTEVQDAKIVFGAPTASASGWLQNDSTEKENLSVFLQISVTNPDQVPDKGIKVTVAEVDGGTGKYSTANGHGYVGALPTYTISKDAVSSGSYTQEIKFTWGSHFGNQNPYSYYSGKDIDGKVPDQGELTYGNDALASLNGLKTDLAGVSYKVTVETDTSAAA